MKKHRSDRSIFFLSFFITAIVLGFIAAIFVADSNMRSVTGDSTQAFSVNRTEEHATTFTVFGNSLSIRDSVFAPAAAVLQTEADFFGRMVPAELQNTAEGAYTMLSKAASAAGDWILTKQN